MHASAAASAFSQDLPIAPNILETSQTTSNSDKTLYRLYKDAFNTGIITINRIHNTKDIVKQSFEKWKFLYPNQNITGSIIYTTVNKIFCRVNKKKDADEKQLQHLKNIHYYVEYLNTENLSTDNTELFLAQTYYKTFQFVSTDDAKINNLLQAYRHAFSIFEKDYKNIEALEWVLRIYEQLIKIHNDNTQNFQKFIKIYPYVKKAIVNFPDSDDIHLKAGKFFYISRQVAVSKTISLLKEAIEEFKKIKGNLEKDNAILLAIMHASAIVQISHNPYCQDSQDKRKYKKILQEAENILLEAYKQHIFDPSEKLIKSSNKPVEHILIPSMKNLTLYKKASQIAEIDYFRCMYNSKKIVQYDEFADVIFQVGYSLAVSIQDPEERIKAFKLIEPAFINSLDNRPKDLSVMCYIWLAHYVVHNKAKLSVNFIQERLERINNLRDRFKEPFIRNPKLIIFQAEINLLAIKNNVYDPQKTVKILETTTSDVLQLEGDEKLESLLIQLYYLQAKYEQDELKINILYKKAYALFQTKNKVFNGIDLLKAAMHITRYIANYTLDTNKRRNILCDLQNYLNCLGKNDETSWNNFIFVQNYANCLYKLSYTQELDIKGYYYSNVSRLKKHFKNFNHTSDLNIKYLWLIRLLLVQSRFIDDMLEKKRKLSIADEYLNAINTSYNGVVDKETVIEKSLRQAEIGLEYAYILSDPIEKQKKLKDSEDLLRDKDINASYSNMSFFLTIKFNVLFELYKLVGANEKAIYLGELEKLLKEIISFYPDDALGYALEGEMLFEISKHEKGESKNIFLEKAHGKLTTALSKNNLEFKALFLQAQILTEQANVANDTATKQQKKYTAEQILEQAIKEYRENKELKKYTRNYVLTKLKNKEQVSENLFTYVSLD